MPKPPWEDLDQFLDDKTGFAVTAKLVLRDETERTILGIFDEPSLTAVAGRQYHYNTTAPTFSCKEADVHGVVRGDRLIMGDRTFDLLKSPRIDGTGWAMLELNAAVGSEWQ